MTVGVSPHSTSKIMNGMEDDDGRTRNAKAQRRHREKRKAHLKALEESVQLLTAQLEDARRQLSTAAYRGAVPGGPPLSPGSKEYVALQQENTYLREENAELRRQLYSYSVGRYGHPPAEGEVKQEAFPSYGQGPLASPREGSSHGRGQMPPSAGESSSGPSSSTSSYPPQVDHFTPLSGRSSRNRVMSSSSAPAVSPYLPSSSAFPTDPRAHAHSLSQPQQMDRYPPIRYEPHLYPSSANHSPTGAPGGGQPPPHNLPRSGLSYEHVDMYAGEREQPSSWGPEAGPPPFQGSVYPVTYSDGPQQEEWRQTQDHSH